jgi:hypothetical protein
MAGGASERLDAAEIGFFRGRRPCTTFRLESRLWYHGRSMIDPDDAL